MDKKKLSKEELEQVNGGNIFGDAWDWFCDTITHGEISAPTDCTHSNCGGHISIENHGTYHPDIWLKCQQCGKSWHPHNYSKISECDGILVNK